MPAMLTPALGGLLAAQGGKPFNPILPEPNEMIWGTLSFLVLFAVLVKFGFPAIRQSLKEREDRIRGDLEAAEQAKNEAQQKLEEYQRQLSDARGEANRIIEEARQAAEEVRRDLTAKAEQEAAEMRERAQADLEATVSQTRSQLQRQMADFAVGLAEKIVEKSLDRDAQRSLIDRYIEQVSSMGDGARAGSRS
jgi:F-type H+-transporting ATPase subunit b